MELKTIRKKDVKVYRASRVIPYIKRCIIFFLAFTVSSLIFKEIIPSPSIPPNLPFISSKYEYFIKHKDEYDTIFIGSSRICNQVVPDVFDNVMKSLGKSTNSFNFGIPAMRALPSYFLLKEILAEPPENLKWVFIEIDLDSVYEPIENVRTTRSIYWHNFNNTLFVLKYIFNSNQDSLIKKILTSISHLIPYLYNQINVGRMFDQVILQTSSHNQEKLVESFFIKNDGYYPLDLIQKDPNRQKFLQHLDTYNLEKSKLAHLKQEEYSQTKLPSKNKLSLLSLIIKQVEAVNAKPVFILPPRLENKQKLQQAYQQGYIPLLLSFNDPIKFPELYQVNLRHDKNHLNHEGSEHLTRLIAKAFVNKLHDN